MNPQIESDGPWYAGITRYQWLVLLIASLGWIFDVFEGQIFVAAMNKAVDALATDLEQSTKDFYNKIAFGAFLLGGAVGGIGFGKLSDRIGRTKTMIYTILMYSCFTFVTVFAETWWQMVALRFLVAMGVGGEWAVATAMVAEVVPQRARARMLGIFHASSIFGTLLAVLAKWFIIDNPDISWRWGFALGALPALLIIWIRLRLKEPEQWVEAQRRAKEDSTQETGKLSDLFAPALIRNSLIGLTLAGVGLATFWGIHVYGKDYMRNSVRRAEFQKLASDAEYQQSVAQGKTADEFLASAGLSSVEILAVNERINRAGTLGMLLTTVGGGLGLLAFGPLCERIGRRGAFVLFHLGGLVVTFAMILSLPVLETRMLWFALPVFGFLTLGMHAGYAIYFPELFPTRLRGSGGGLCFNGGRVLAAVVMVGAGWAGSRWDLSLETVSLLIGSLFIFGAVLMLFARETKGTELPT